MTPPRSGYRRETFFNSVRLIIYLNFTTFSSTFTFTGDLLGGNAGSLVPGKVDAVVLDAFLFWLFLRRDKPSPSVLLAMRDGLFFCVELDDHVRERVSGGRPAHQWVFPAFAAVELHSPGLEVVGTALHAVLWWNKDADSAVLDMLLGNSVNRCE